ncbi:hypothetical protein NPIL_171211 [Nephila pilipes]|uniref:Uncharacterized protein n=1 Tax=Nephila pilipes TaxID=299642 RepID=A0A8X6Q1M9_NEPPI|nr:hypothetical protein NPIL_171211 [Nephila pilipes]
MWYGEVEWYGMVARSYVVWRGPILLEAFGPILRGWYLVGSYQDGRWNGRRHSRHVPPWIKGNGEEGFYSALSSAL